MINNKLRELIKGNVVTVGVNTPLIQIIEVMEENHINHIPVLGEDDMIAGILSKHDIYRNLLRLSMNTTGKTYSEKSMAAITAEEIMTLDVVELSPESTVKEAAEILMEGEFHACPIVENYKVIGIVTSKDIMTYLTSTT
jgi:CBS domain-containing protein